MPYVYSTLTADQAYSIWKGGNEIKRPERICLIRGGANVANKQLVTPMGVATFVTEQQLELLNQCDGYLRHKKAGYIREDRKDVGVEKAVADLKPKDESAPLVPQDFDDKKAPKTNRKKSAVDDDE